MRLRAVDVPESSRSSGASSLSGYYKIDNESDGYSKLSDGYSKLSDFETKYSRSVSSANDSDPSLKEESTEPNSPLNNQTVLGRPPMKTPDLSHSSSSEDDPATGEEMMKTLANRLGQGGPEKRKQSREKRQSSKKAMERLEPLSISATPLYEASEESDSYTIVSENRRDSGVFPAPLRSRRALERLHKKEPQHDENSSDDEHYDYTSLEKPRLLNVNRRTERSRQTSIPSSCFKSLQMRLVATDGSDPLGIGGKMEKRTYLASHSFFGYFSGGFYEWGERLKLNGLQGATAFKAGICCLETRSHPPPSHYAMLEFQPALRLPDWPDAAAEWRFRKRNTVRDPNTRIAYVWPSQSVVESITKQGCYLLIDGGRLRGRHAPQTPFQWQLGFSNAEDSLLMTLSNCHLQCLMWILLIYQHVLAPIQVLDTYHIKTLFFWLVERNYVDWEQASLGDRVFFFFKQLYYHVKRRKLLHYFIRKRNLLASKRPSDMLKVQERIYRLLEKFVPFTLQAVARIQSSNSIYALPNVAELWNLLTTKSTLASINPTLAILSESSDLVKKKPKEGPTASAKSDDDHGFWDHQARARPKDRTRQLLHQKYVRREAGEREKKVLSRSGDSSFDTVNLDERIGVMDSIRTKLVLNYFIRHFIDMTRAASQCYLYDTAIVVLNQAENLTTLLREAGYHDDADEFSETIAELRQVCYPNQFSDEIVNIPGSPRVFATGITVRSNLVRQENGFINWREEAVPAVPRAEPLKSNALQSVQRNVVTAVTIHEPKSEPARTPPTQLYTAVKPKSNRDLMVASTTIHEKKSKPVRTPPTQLYAPVKSKSNHQPPYHIEPSVIEFNGSTSEGSHGDDNRIDDSHLAFRHVDLIMDEDLDDSTDL